MDGQINDGGAAFPQPRFDSSGERVGWNPGMSLRDYFAGQALVGLLLHPCDTRLVPLGPETTPRRAYEYADAMLAARKQPIA